MDPCAATAECSCRSCPHARGDGPKFFRDFKNATELSPRAWGWTGRDGRVRDPPLVVPPRVGMDRNLANVEGLTFGCPHARGDGPCIVSTTAACPELSPRAWGWTGTAPAVRREPGVVPTRVGMDRSHGGAMPSWRSCPHARGDGPILQLTGRLVRSLSPRAWGWTVRQPRRRALRDVVPTRVGMDRTPGRGS